MAAETTKYGAFPVKPGKSVLAEFVHDFGCLWAQERVYKAYMDLITCRGVQEIRNPRSKSKSLSKKKEETKSKKDFKSNKGCVSLKLPNSLGFLFDFSV